VQNRILKGMRDGKGKQVADEDLEEE